MDAGEHSRRKGTTIAALDPETGEMAEVFISYDRMQSVGRRSLGHAKECGYVVPAILQAPTAVFEGLTQDVDEDRRGYGWRCYVGIPHRAYGIDGSERAPYPGQVYLVFVNEDRVAYNWRWEKADADDPKLPAGHERRFRKRLL